jgi:hypothetical protein
MQWICWDSAVFLHLKSSHIVAGVRAFLCLPSKRTDSSVRCQITSGDIGVAIALIFGYDARNLMIWKILSQ